MTSESSSAVLDLNNVDAEDTEPPSTTEDTKDIVPLIMEHGYDIVVKVDAPMKQLSTLETFVTYRVRCVCARWQTPPYVRRRYNHFKLLHRRLSQCHPLLAAPPLPPLHSARQQLDRYSPSFVAVRTLALHAFLERVAKHPILTYSDDFRTFLTTPDEELDKVFRSENSALNLWGLGAALYGSGEAKPANGARVKDPEFSSASDYLQSLQQKLSTLCTLTTKLQKGTAALSNEMMGMKLACDQWSEQERRMKRACDLWSCQERASVSRASGACACGANAAHRAALAAARAPPTHRAVLPMLAAYAGAHVDKINSRDAVHATYVAGANTASEVHNRLEQASEALRSELVDWLPKTHADIKNQLLDLATRQVNLQTQILLGWEHALKLSTDATVDEMFKTVSKSAIQNLSPSKCRSPNETERDFDDFEDVSNDSDSRDAFVSDDGNAEVDVADSAGLDGAEFGNADDNDEITAEAHPADSATSNLDTAELVNEKHHQNLTKVSNNEINSDIKEMHSKSDTTEENAESANCVNSESDSAKIDSEVTNSVNSDTFRVPSDVTKGDAKPMSDSAEFLNEILNDTATDDKGIVLDDNFKDPLTEFADVDLS